MGAKTSSIRFAEAAVIKSFGEADLFYRELEVYRLGLPETAALLDYRPPHEITLQRLHGIPYLDAPEGFDPLRLGLRIAGFHRATMDQSKCLCHIDNQPKNVLLCDGDYYLIDFSDSRVDWPEYDLTHLLLFWADMYAPVALLSLAEAFIEAYASMIPLDAERWTRCLEQNTLRFDARRALHNKRPAFLPAELVAQNRSYLKGLPILPR